MKHPDRARYRLILVLDESCNRWFVTLTEVWHGRRARTFTANYAFPLDAALAAYEQKNTWARERQEYGDNPPPTSGGTSDLAWPPF